MPVPSRVFLGARISEEDRTDLKQICTVKGIEIWQMEIAPDAFQLVSSRGA